MPRFLSLVYLRWTHVHSKLPLSWGPRLNNHMTRRLRDHPNRCLVSSCKYWSLIGEISQALSHPWLYGQDCDSGGYDNSWYRGDGVFKAVARGLLAGWLIFAAIVCFWYPGALLLLITCTGLELPYIYKQNTWKTILPEHCGKAL